MTKYLIRFSGGARAWEDEEEEEREGEGEVNVVAADRFPHEPLIPRAAQWRLEGGGGGRDDTDAASSKKKERNS